MDGCEPAGRRLKLVAAALLGVASLFCAGAQAASALTITSASLHAVEGASYGGEIGEFSGDLLFCSASSYSATVTWANATSASPATVTALPGSACGFAISVPGNQARVFAEETASDAANRGRYTLSVNGPLLARASATGSATVDDAALAAGPARSLGAIAGSATTATVATFSDANPAATPADFSAIVDWGDGTTPSAAPVTADGGHFDVGAGHVYATPGPYSASVTITDAGGSKVSSSASIDVAGPGAPAIAATAATPGTSATTSSASAASPPVPKLVISKPRFGSRGAILVILQCPAGGADCRGDVVLSALADPRAKDRRLRHATALGSALFILAAGSSERLDVRLTKSMQRLLAHAGSVRARVVATSFGPSGSVASAGSVGTLRPAR